MEPLLEVKKVNCRYGDKTIISDLSFSLAKHQIISLLGPSGCGKTTVLRAIAGLEQIYSGSIELEGECLSSTAMTIPPEQRKVGMVFQDYALFPHMTIRDNIAFGLQGKSVREKNETVSQLLSLIKLDDYADYYPHQLSGGQQQRVALARALAPSPKMLLLDEPFSNLDTELRRSLSFEVREILKQSNISAILVTHDQSEAFSVADEIGILLNGTLQQWGTAQDLFHHPRNQFVASFIGNGKFIPGEVSRYAFAKTLFGEIHLPNISELAVNTRLNILVRPWNICVAENGNCSGKIIQQQFNGAHSSTSLRLQDDSIVESSDERLQSMPLGTTVRLQLNSNDLLGFQV